MLALGVDSNRFVRERCSGGDLQVVLVMVVATNRRIRWECGKKWSYTIIKWNMCKVYLDTLPAQAREPVRGSTERPLNPGGVTTRTHVLASYRK